MVRLIDADELMKTLMHEGLGYQYNRVMCAPTVDAVPVIRCKDCKYYHHGENPSETWSVCTTHINRYYETCADNFCSWAERKSE